MISARRVLLVVALAAFGAAAMGGTARAATAAKSSRLVSFSSCPALLTYAKAHATPYVGPYGFGRPVTTSIGVAKSATATAAAPYSVPSLSTAASATDATTPVQGVDYSGTNVQEVGVDEPDSVKTDGKTLFAVEGNQLNAVDVSGPQPKLLDTLTLDNGWSHELLLSGTHLLVLSRGGYWVQPLPALSAQILPIIPSDSVITEIDVSNPSALTVMNTLTLDGAYVDARMVGSTVRIVSSSQMPLAVPFATPQSATTAGLAAAKATNRAAVASSKISAWLPSYRIGSGPARSVVQCRDIRRPVQFSGLGMLTVLTIDLSQGLTPVDSTAIMTDGRIVYASPTSLYVTTESWASRPDPSSPTDAPSSVTTTINKFDISSPTKTVYMGSGTVQGYLLDQWSMSEFQGVLRVVSTDAPAWWGSSGDTQSYLTTLGQGNGGLVQLGRVGGLGQGDRVYAVRFVGNAGYVVTFKQVDPLYTLDLSDPANPKVVGEVTLPGYSSYLHPIGNDLLLGIGQDVDTATNEPTGTQVSLFDVSDLAHPTRLFHDSLGQGWSEAESDHHAFLYWAPTGLVVVPFGQQAVAMHVSRSAGITELGRIVQTQANQSSLPTIDRSVVVGSSLLTVSSAGVASNGLTSLASLGWAPFPAVTTPPGPIRLPTPMISNAKP
ncbi:MAG TPA: beta-propeller domain-containing protein [Gaiellaceae bacterium]|nr:beta-propeller domain-containing protein [Gaiellaceae bacterium]